GYAQQVADHFSFVDPVYRRDHLRQRGDIPRGVESPDTRVGVGGNVQAVTEACVVDTAPGRSGHLRLAGPDLLELFQLSCRGQLGHNLAFTTHYPDQPDVGDFSHGSIVRDRGAGCVRRTTPVRRKEIRGERI